MAEIIPFTSRREYLDQEHALLLIVDLLTTGRLELSGASALEVASQAAWLAALNICRIDYRLETIADSLARLQRLGYLEECPGSRYRTIETAMNLGAETMLDYRELSRHCVALAEFLPPELEAYVAWTYADECCRDNSGDQWCIRAWERLQHGRYCDCSDNEQVARLACLATLSSNITPRINLARAGLAPLSVRTPPATQ